MIGALGKKSLKTPALSLSFCIVKELCHCNCYCKCNCLNAIVTIATRLQYVALQTRVLRKTLEPVFDETFTFYGVAYSTLPDLTLHFLVLSFDRFARDDVIGEAAVPLAGVDPSTGRVHITQQISKRHIQVRKGKGRMEGGEKELLVFITFI